MQHVIARLTPRCRARDGRGAGSLVRGPRSLRVFLVGCVLVILGVGRAPAETPAWVATGQEAMVAADHPSASRIGLAVLRDGGNAADAAVAVSFALAVTRPESTGLGGGGFFIYRDAASGEATVLDYRERAPGTATANMYLRAKNSPGASASPSEHGALAAGVPGQVAGLAEIHRRFGTQPWPKLIERAAALAENGYPVDAHLVDATRTAQRILQADERLRKQCHYLDTVFLRGGDLRQVGDVIQQPNFARLLRHIAEHGADGFYRGEVARGIAKAVQAAGGIITEEDLASYKLKEREPLIGTYRGYQIITMPPPSSGGTVLLECLNILETFDLARIHREDEAAAWHLVAEAMKLAFADRADLMGDADFVEVPVDRLVSKGYASIQAKQIRPDAALDSRKLGGLPPPDDDGTSHFCIVDAAGNCVVSTETINTTFGSKFAVEPWGLILNNEMDDFTAEPGKPNAFGLRQSDRNAIEPGKRPLSSMTPVIVAKDGRVVLLLGGSGGPRIISAVLNVLVRHLDFGEDLPRAVAATRVHHQWMPDRIVFDREPDAALAAGLTQRGHVLSPERREAAVQAVARAQGGWIGVSDPRKGGSPAGY